MTSVKQRLLKIISVILIIYPAVAVIWQILPEDITQLIPKYTEYVAFMAGVPSGVLGAVGLNISKAVDSTNKTNVEVFKGLNIGYQAVASEVLNVKADVKGLQNDFAEMKELQKEANLLKRAELELKLNNRFITEESKAKVKQMLGDVDEV